MFFRKKNTRKEKQQMLRELQIKSEVQNNLNNFGEVLQYGTSGKLILVPKKHTSQTTLLFS